MAVKISVAIASFNEEKNIKRCLNSVRQLADEIVVVDGGSQDKTVEIAKKCGAKVFITDNPPIFHINKQKAIDKCNGDWILQLDADEEVTNELRDEMKAIIGNSASAAAYFIPRKNYFLGHWLKKGGQYPDHVIRFFRNGKAYLPCKSVHEQMKVKGKVGYLKGHLLHFTAPTFSRYLTNANRYTNLLAQEIKDREKKNCLFDAFLYLIFKPLHWFFLTFIRHKGFLDSWQGFVFSFFSALRFPVAYIKYLGVIKKTPNIQNSNDQNKLK